MFRERFALAVKGKLNENATRILGSFFLSMNVTVGTVLLLAFFLAYEHKPLFSPVPLILCVLLLAGIFTTWFRYCNTKWALQSLDEIASPAGPVAQS